MAKPHDSSPPHCARNPLTSGLAALLGALLVSATPALATTFALVPLDLGSGYSLGGRIETDGTTGALTAANLTDWTLTVTAVSDILYTPVNTVNISSQVSVAGDRLIVPTSPDGVGDGGLLAFYHNSHFQVRVADFTGAYANGGVAMYAAGPAFDFLSLYRPAGIDYVAATAATPGGNVFDLVPKHFGGTTVMSGSITTDGSTGPAQLTDWNILIRDTQKWTFTPANSHVASDFGLATNGDDLTVTPFDANGSPGAFSIGSFLGGDFNGVLLGDYSWDASGVAGYLSPLVFQTISNLPLDAMGNFVVAEAVPEPAAWATMIAGLGLVGTAARRRRTPRVAH